MPAASPLREPLKRDRKGDKKTEKMEVSSEEVTPSCSSEEESGSFDDETLLEQFRKVSYQWHNDNRETLYEIARTECRSEAQLQVPIISKSEVSLALSRQKLAERKPVKTSIQASIS